MTDSERRDPVDSLDRQFTTISQRLAAVAQRFDAMEERSAQRHREVLGRFEGVHVRVERLHQLPREILGITGRIEALLRE